MDLRVGDGCDTGPAKHFQYCIFNSLSYVRFIQEFSVFKNPHSDCLKEGSGGQ
jgi:hypothetical protein